MTTLVVVESPGKVSKIQSILGSKYHVCASSGHIIDLDDKSISVDIKNNFEPIYQPKNDKKSIIRDLKRLYSKYQDILIATDDDREGEMIAWSIKHILELNNPKRIAFKAITKTDILNSVREPRYIDDHLVSAQKARRVIDRIVGFETTPTLYKHFKMPNLSAGRVQSVTVRRLVDREVEIEKFKQNNNESFFKTKCKFEPNIESMLHHNSNNNEIKTQSEAEDITKKCIKSEFIITKVKTSKVTRSPLPPYITSTLQQDAHKRFGFNSKMTMNIAQKLYESGLITYMRTDSVAISNDAMVDLKKYIINEYGEKYYRHVQFKTKSKNAQEAHECIRPTHVEQQQTGMPNEYEKLYKMIWMRTVACQMSPAEYDATEATISVSQLPNYYCSTTIRKLTFKGFLILGSEDHEENNNDKVLPKEGTKLILSEIVTDEHYHNHPPRFDEASLIKELEHLGIGRPSTYDKIISTITKRNYVIQSDTSGIKKTSTRFVWNKKDNQINTFVDEKTIWEDKKKYIPTYLGTNITEFLVQYFPNIMDYKFTADLEDKFDEIAGNRYTYNQLLKEFYDQFHPFVIKVMTMVKVGTNDKLLGNHDGCTYYVTVNKYGPVVKKINGDNCIYSNIYPPLTTETIKISDVIELFKYPRTLGKLEEHDILLCNGPFGYYLKHNDKNVSIKSNDITFDEAIKLVNEKERKVKFADDKYTYSINEGKFGTYIAMNDSKAGKVKNIPIPKNKRANVTTLEDIKKIIAEYNEYKKANPVVKKKPFFNKKT